MAESRDNPAGSISDAKRKLLEQRLKGRIGAVRERAGGMVKRPPNEPPLASAGQRRIWLLHQMEPDSPNYNISQYLVYPAGSIRLERVRQAMDQVLVRHPALRTTFNLEDGKLLQVVHREMKSTVQVLECGEPESLESGVVQSLMRPFDLEEGPLFRIVFGTAGDRTFLGFSFHHIIFDEWSTGVFFREFSGIYNALQNDEGHGLPEPGFDYTDFAYSQIQYSGSEELKQQLHYWKTALANPPGPLVLATDRPYPEELTDLGAMEKIRLEGALARAIKDQANADGRSGLPVFMLGFQLLLSIYSQADDILVGTPVANRRYRETGNMIGFFLNTLCIRQDLSADPASAKAIEATQKACMEAIRNQDAPFDEVLKEIDYERVAGRHPLMQHMFVFQQEADVAPVVKLGDSDAIAQWVDVGRSKFDLTLFVVEGKESFELMVEYRTCLFDAASIRRMLDRYVVILGELLSKPDTPVSKLNYIPVAEMRRLDAFSRGSVISEKDAAGIGALLSGPLQTGGDAIAVIDPETSLTYGELQHRVNRLARAICTQSGGSNTPVGIHVPRSAAAIVALLAALRAGRPYLPLDPDYPADRLRFMIEDSGAGLVISTEENPGVFENIAGVEVSTEEDLNSLADEGSPLPSLYPERPAYIIYTSGSSGTPKGVMVPFSCLQHSTAARVHYYRENPGNFLLISSLSFDSSVAGIFWTLGTGGSLCLPDRPMIQDPAQLGAFIKANSVSALLCVPSYYRELLRANGDNLRSLRMAIVAGESCPQGLIEAHYQILSGCRLFNEYGPTEATVWASVHAIDNKDTQASRVPIGKPIPNSLIHVIDRKNRLMAPGLPGEICIGGDGVTPGYLNRPEATARSFQNIPSIGRVYRSGDQGVWDSSGNLYFLGRLDNQVKVRGYRIETGEIEEALNAHPEVAAATVFVVERSNAPASLVGFVKSSASDADSLVIGLREHLAGRLPDYMIPARIIALPELPQLPNGKTDRHALEALLESDRQAASIQSSQATNENQNALLRILQDVLGISEIKAQDNFFNLGGDSILAIQAVSKAREAGLSLTVGNLLASKSVGQLIDSVQPAAPKSTIVDNPVGAAPLTPIQSWLLERPNVDPGRWNLSVLLDVHPEISSEEIQDSLLKLIQHHDALRTAIYRRGSGWVQSVLPFKDGTFHLEYVELPQNRERGRSVLTETAQRLQASIKLGEGDLVKGAFFNCQGGKNNQLLLIIHHMAVDWVSWKILLDDLESLLNSKRNGVALVLPEKTASFRSWANALASYAESDALREEAQFWKNMAYDKCSAIPLDSGSREDNLEGSEEILGLEFSRNETEQILTAAKRLGVSPQAILFGGIARSLGDWCSTSSVLVDLEGHGREECVGILDTTRTVGWFTSQFPVVFNLKNDSAERVYFKSIQAELDDVPHHGIGFGILKYLARHDPELASIPEPEVTLNYLGRRDTSTADGLVSAKKWAIGDDRDKNSCRTAIIEIISYLSPDQLVANWSYSSRLHRRPTIAKIVDGTKAFILEAVQAVLSGDAAGMRHPLTDAQSTLLAHHLLPNSPDQGQIQLQIVLEGPFSKSLFRSTWDHLVRTYPVLRTTVQWKSLSSPVQIVQEQIDWDFTYLDCQHKSDDEIASELKSLVEVDSGTPLDLASGRTFRLSVLQSSETRACLVWTCHHILLDGWSSALILNRMVETYNLLLDGKEPAAVKSPPFRDYCEWISSRPQTRARVFWRSKFKGVSAAHITSAAPRIRGANVPGEQHRISRRLDSLEKGNLESIARDCQVTPFAVLLATWTFLLSELVGTDRVVTGITVSGRFDRVPGEGDMAGMLANTIPVVANPDPTLTFKAWCRELFEDLQGYREFDYCSEKQILEWTGLPGTRPLFDCLFIFANQPIEKREQSTPDSLKIADIKGGFTSSFPVTVIFRDWDGFFVDVVANPQLVNPEVADHIASRINDVMQEILASPQVPLSNLERQRTPFNAHQAAEPEPEDAFAAGGFEPKTPLEARIQTVWDTVFNRHQMGLEADFFSIGGNSLLATSLIAELNRVLDSPVSIDALFRAPSIRSLASLVQEESARDSSATRDSLLVPIQPTGDRIPLVMIHPLDGDIYQYHLLGRHLPDDQPLYAIHAPQQAFTNIDDMAEHYLSLVLDKFPDGRFLLGGYCFGAGIAFNMLQKMAQRGLDRYPLVAIDFMYMNLVRFRPTYLFKLLREENLSSFSRRVRGWSSKIGKRVKRLLHPEGKGFEKDIEDFFELPELPDATRQKIETHFFLLSTKRPKPYFGDVALILSESTYSRHDKWVGWDRFTRGHLLREVVDVEHTRMMEEDSIGKVAVALLKILQTVNQTDQGRSFK